MVMVGPVGNIKVEYNKGNLEWRNMSETRGCGVQLQGPLENARSSIRYALEKEAFRGEKRQDESRGWPMISSVMQKKSKTTFADTKKLLVFIGSKESRREAAGKAFRNERRTPRAADKWANYHKAWAKRLQSGASKRALIQDAW